MKNALTLLGIAALVLFFTSTRLFAAGCTCSNQICISEQQSALYLACVTTEQGAGLSVGYTSTTTAIFKAVGKSQSAEFLTKCGKKSVPLLPALQDDNLFKIGQTMSQAIKVYSVTNQIHKRDVWASFETKSSAECLTAAKTIP